MRTVVDLEFSDGGDESVSSPPASPFPFPMMGDASHIPSVDPPLNARYPKVKA